MPDLHSVQWQLQLILRSFASSGGGAEKPAPDIASTIAMLLHLVQRRIVFLTLSLRLTLLLLLAFVTQVIRSFPPSLSVITLIPLQSSYHTSGTLGCWWLGRHLLSLTAIAITTLTHNDQGKEFVTYEVTKKGKRIPLSLQEPWLKEYEWLSYSPSQHAGYGKYWVLFKAKLTKGVLGTVVKTPFKNFSKVKGKDGYLTNHDIYDYHHDASSGLHPRHFFRSFILFD